MCSSRTSRALVVLVVVSPAQALAAPELIGLGGTPGYTNTSAEAISADGGTVVGSSTNGNTTQAFRWTHAHGFENLGVLPGATFSLAHAVNQDGSVIVGTSGLYAFRWSSGSGMTSLNTLGAGGSSVGLAVSGDGTIATGFSSKQPDTFYYAYRWDTSGGMQDLGYVFGSEALGISQDGSTIVGDVNGWGFRRTSSEGTQYLQPITGDTGSFGAAASANGSIVTGASALEVQASPSVRDQAVRWLKDGTVQSLGNLAGGAASFGIAINGDGSAIVGSALTIDGYHAFLWTESQGMLDLRSYLAASGVDVTGWVFDSANGISADGTSICGTGSYQGQNRAWVVFGVPNPSSILVLGAPCVLAGQRTRRCLSNEPRSH